MKSKDIADQIPDTGHGEHFGQIIADQRYAGDVLLPEITQLYALYQQVGRRAEKLATENEQLKTQLVNMVRSLDLASRVDGMTGLANRRDIMEKIEREATRSHRHQHPFTILLVDVDDFKRVNDAHGFNTGDDVLVELARELSRCIRNEDICARWGGEEFLILLPETSAVGSLVVTHKVLESVDMTEFKASKPGIRITVSIGVCEYDPSLTIYDCISRADQALQQAKRDGKNRHAVAE